MKKRHKMMVALSAVAACALLLTALALAAVRLTEPRPDAVVAAKGGGETETVTEQDMEDGDALPTPLPEMMEVISVTPIPTPMPTPEPTALPELAELADVTPSPTPIPTPMPTPEPTPLPELAELADVTPSPTPIPNALADGYGDIVYALAHGNYYHSDPNCSGMEEAVAWTEASAALMGKRPCPVCLGDAAGAENTAIQSEETEEIAVYYTDEGTYYHSNAQCSDMLEARRHTLAEAEADGKRRCPDCQPVEPDHYDLFLAAFGRGLDALYPGYAYSYASVTDFFVDRSAWYVSDGESTLEACLVTNGLTEDKDGEGIIEIEGDVYRNVMGFTLNADEFNNLWAFLADAPQPLRGLMTDESAEDAAWAAVNSGDDAFGGTLELKNVWAAVKPDGTVEGCTMTFVDASRAEGPTLEVRVSWDRQEGGEYAMHTRTTVLPAETNGDIVIFPSYPAPASNTVP